MSVSEARSCSSLQCVPHVRTKNGSSLSMGEQLRWFSQLQVFHAFPWLRPSLLYVHCRDVTAILHTILEGELSNELHVAIGNYKFYSPSFTSRRVNWTVWASFIYSSCSSSL